MPLDKDWVQTLYTRFQEIYGASFTESYKSPMMKNLWMTLAKNGLNGLSNAEIKRGLYICKLYHQNPIPNIVQFWHYCKGIKYKAGKNRWNQNSFK